jgi:hypothetical protein
VPRFACPALKGRQALEARLEALKDLRVFFGGSTRANVLMCLRQLAAPHACHRGDFFNYAHSHTPQTKKHTPSL